MREPWSLPAGWRWQRFDETARVVSQLVKPDEFPDLPHIAPNHIESQTGRLLPYATVRADGVISSKHLFEPGSVLYSKIRPYLAKVVVVDFQGLCSADMYPLESDVVEPRFLKWWMLHPEFTKLASGEQARTVLPKINRRALGQLPVPVPPRPVQSRIVELLEEHLSHVDAAVAYLDAAKRRNEQLLRSVLWLHTHGINGAKSVRLDSIAEVRLGRQRSPKNHSGNRMRPYLRAANVDWSRLRLHDVKEMHFSEAEEATYRLRSGDILLTEASGSPAEVGKSVLYRGEPKGVCFQNTLLRVRAHGADPDFVQKYLLAEAMAGRFMPESRGVGINHLGRFRLAALEVELPPLGQQTAAANKVDGAMAQAARLRSAIQEQEHRVGVLRRALLDAAFSGRLTANARPSVTQREVLVG